MAPTTEAARHLLVAATLVESAPAGSFSRNVLARIQEIQFAVEQNEMRLATWAIDQLLMELEDGAIAEEG